MQSRSGFATSGLDPTTPERSLDSLLVSALANDQSVCNMLTNGKLHTVLADIILAFPCSIFVHNYNRSDIVILVLTHNAITLGHKKLRFMRRVVFAQHFTRFRRLAN